MEISIRKDLPNGTSYSKSFRVPPLLHYITYIILAAVRDRKAQMLDETSGSGVIDTELLLFITPPLAYTG
jgi:hypothetical protein